MCLARAVLSVWRCRPPPPLALLHAAVVPLSVTDR
jgi:hypothetical protein